jgi:hypothetical protein
MSKREKILTGTAALIMLMVCLWPGLSRCSIYYKLIASNIDRIGTVGEDKVWEVSALKKISHKPIKIEIQPSSSKNNFSLGYAEFYLDQNDVCEITIINEQIVLIKCYTYSIGFLPPAESITVADDINKHSEAKPELLPKDFYQARVKAAYVGPKTYFQIFFMPTNEFAEYLTLCMIKLMFSTNESSIGIFETDRIKGLIGFGGMRLPNRIFIDLYTADSKISQEIIVNSDSPEKTREIALSLLSSYNYLIEKPLNDSVLTQVIFDKVSVHPLFRKDNPEEAQ